VATYQSTGRVEELGEDLVVAIREFSERHPGTEPREIRQALHLVASQTPGGRPRFGSPLTTLVAFGAGLVVGLTAH